MTTSLAAFIEQRSEGAHGIVGVFEIRKARHGIHGSCCFCARVLQHAVIIAFHPRTPEPRRPRMGGCLGFLFIIGVIVLAIWAISKSIQEAEADRKAEEAEIARQHSERARDAAEQADLKRQMLALNEESLRALESLPLKLESAERHLDRAETDFAEEAFAPFWDSIEKAANELAGFDQGVHVVRNSSST